MDVEFVEFQPTHIDAAMEFWSRTEGVGLGTADSPEGMKAYFDENPGMSFVALESGKLVGTVLCGSDGRRGYIYHLAVAEDLRRSGIAQGLVQRALAGLRSAGILKCHIMVFRDNQLAASFWEGTGWERRDDLRVFSIYTND